MAIQVERVETNLGGAYDAKFLRTHRCGHVTEDGTVCDGSLSLCYRDGEWWIRCWESWEHSAFEHKPSWYQLYRRGENPAAELLRGPLPGTTPIVESEESLAIGDARLKEILGRASSGGRTVESDYDDLFGTER